MVAIIIIALVVLFAGGNFATWKTTSDYYTRQAEAVEAKAQSDYAIAMAAEETKRAAKDTKIAELEVRASAVREVEVVKWRTVKKEVDRVVQNVVYRECRLDDDGVRIFNAAASGLGVQLATPAGKTPAVQPTPANPQAGRNDGRPASGSGGDIRVVPRV